MGEHLPCKQGVMGSNPIISTMGQKVPQMFIENRINKRNETDSCILILLMRIIEKNLLDKTKWFFRTIVWRKSNENYSTNNFVTSIDRNIY